MNRLSSTTLSSFYNLTPLARTRFQITWCPPDDEPPMYCTRFSDCQLLFNKISYCSWRTSPNANNVVSVHNLPREPWVILSQGPRALPCANGVPSPRLTYLVHIILGWRHHRILTFNLLIFYRTFHSILLDRVTFVSPCTQIYPFLQGDYWYRHGFLRISNIPTCYRIHWHVPPARCWWFMPR